MHYTGVGNYFYWGASSVYFEVTASQTALWEYLWFKKLLNSYWLLALLEF